MKRGSWYIIALPIGTHFLPQQIQREIRVGLEVTLGRGFEAGFGDRVEGAFRFPAWVRLRWE